MNKLLTLFLFALLTLTLLPNTVSASYGGPATGRAVLDKTIYNPQSNTFVDNLNVDSQHFLAGQEVKFRIEATNSLNQELTDVKIIDRLPSNVSYTSSVGGKYDASSHTLTINVGTLKIGESKTYEILGKIKESTDKAGGVACHTNVAELRTENKGGNQMLEQDTASFCVTTKVLGVTQELPKTGPGLITFTAISSTLGLAISAFLYKKSRA